MRTLVLFGLIATGMACICGTALAGPFVVQEHEGTTSYTMPSISPAGGPGEFYITYVGATDYHMCGFAGSGDIFAGKIMLDQTTGQSQWIEEPVKLNEMPAMVGPPSNESLGNPMIRNLIARPGRRGDYIAWGEFYNPDIHYYNFNDGCEYIIPRIGGTSRGINPVVSEYGTIAYWTRGPEPLWTLRVRDEGGELFNITDPNYIPTYSFVSRARRADILELESGEIRVAYSRCLDENTLELWCSSESIEGEPVGGYTAQPDNIISSIQLSDEFIIWQERFFDAPPDTEGEIHFGVWNGCGYEYSGIAGLTSSSRDPSLFGSYLVYVSPDCEQLLMTDLRDQYSEPMVLLSADPDHTLNWPAVWVDEETGEYVVLYESMGSPTDIMGQAGVVPEPGTLALLAFGCLTGLAVTRFRRI